MKNFIKKIILLIIFLLTVAIINYYIDPGDRFSKYTLEKNKNVLVLGNIDERLLKLKFIELDKEKKNLILGSSRVMELSFDDSNYINLGVSGANLRDDLALLYYFMKNSKTIPKKIILGVDPWIFNKNEDTRYKIMEKEYKNMLNILIKQKEGKNDSNDKLEKLKYLVKISTFKDSIKIIIKNGIKKYPKIVMTEKNIDEKGNIYKFKDRSYQYSRKFIVNSKGDIKNYKDYQISNFDFLDKIRKEELKLLLKWCKENKIEIILYFPPYNNEYYQKYILNSRYEKLFSEIEEYINSLKEEFNFKTIGKYYDKELSNKDFYDTIHLKSEKIKKYFN